MSLADSEATPSRHLRTPPRPYNFDRMKSEEFALALSEKSRVIPALMAATVTTAAFAKSFVPFYLIGSTPIFVITCLLGTLLLAISWREILKTAVHATDIVLALALLYGVVIANYLVYSSGQVAVTHLVGIVLFHCLFLVFGFAAARALVPIYVVLLAQAAVYSIFIAIYTLRFGDLMRNGFVQDVFGVGVPEMANTFHQNMGAALALAVLAAFGFGARWIRLSALAALPLVLLLMFHIAARTALVSLLGSLIFRAWARLWVRSKRFALISLSVFLVSGTLASGLFYSFALQDKNVDSAAPDAVSRTIREIQSHDPALRLEIWARAWRRIAAEPDRLPFGHGIGTYSIDEGFGAPTWLLDKSTKHYPHNAHLELLYETGIAGLLIFTFITLYPIVVALKFWNGLSTPQRAAVSLYVFYLLSVEISGSFAYSYDFQFFLALAIGVVGLRRRELAGSSASLRGYLSSQASA
jgi:O-antigen ligase